MKNQKIVKTQKANMDNKFVAITRSKDVRTENLKTIKEIIHSTKTFYQLQLLREKKQYLIADLKNISKELIVLFDKLYEFLPEHDMLESTKKPSFRSESNKIKSKTKKALKTSEKTRTESEIERLENSLTKIEQKLRSL